MLHLQSKTGSQKLSSGEIEDFVVRKLILMVQDAGKPSQTSKMSFQKLRSWENEDFFVRKLIFMVQDAGNVSRT